jgi:hypothetical protein
VLGAVKLYRLETRAAELLDDQEPFAALDDTLACDCVAVLDQEVGRHSTRPVVHLHLDEESVLVSVPATGASALAVEHDLSGTGAAASDAIVERSPEHLPPDADTVGRG